MFWIKLILSLIAIYSFWNLVKKPSNYPKGYWGLPLIGYLPLFSKKTIEEHIEDLKRINDKIVGWRIGVQYFVLIFDYKLIKEVFSQTDFTDRPDFNTNSPVISRFQNKKFGILATSGVQWSNVRRFSLHHLRDLGMGKSRLVSAVQFEANDLVDCMKKQAGTSAPLPYGLTVSVLNVIWKLVANKRYELDDPEIRRFELLIRNALLNLVRYGMQDIFPWLRYILPKKVFTKITKGDIYKDISDQLRNFVEKEIQKHEANLDPNNSSDYIDAFLKEMENQKGDPSSTLSREDLVHAVADLFVAGSETTTTTLQWSVFYMANFPDIQKKLQNEIDAILPKGTEATFDYKPKLPYLDAFIHEVLRQSSLVQTGVMHMASVEKTVGGYTIPKGAVVLGITLGPHKDPKYFEAPEQFRPERFLDSDGKFVNPREGFMPFSTGRRQCLGESLSRMELFIFLATFIQNLNFSHPPGEKVRLDAMKTASMIRVPHKEQNVFITCR